MALTADNFSEIVDQFIEIHPFGVKYLRDNLSSIKTVKRADDILFYNIYYSRLFENDDVAFRRVISNNTEYLCICGNINDRFRKSYYGINVRTRYYLRVVATRAMGPNLTEEKELWIIKKELKQ